MKKTLGKIPMLSCVAGLLLTCLTGSIAALLGLRRLDAWCERQLTDI